jgi:hypothetical protein
MLTPNFQLGSWESTIHGQSAQAAHTTSSHIASAESASVRTSGGGGPNAAANYAVSMTVISSQNETRFAPAAPDVT